jgi:hypothetical protein
MSVRILIGVSLAIGFSATPTLSAQETFAKNGNVYFVDENGKEETLTVSERDSAPSLSADGTEVVFVRILRAATPFDTGASELNIVQIISKHEQLILGAPTRLANVEIESVSMPQLSPDKNFVYFLIPYSATAGAVVQLNRQTGKAELLIPGAVEFRVVSRGDYKGHLVASIRKFAFDGEHFFPHYWYYLLDANGRESGFVGKDRSDMDRFFEVLVK